MRYWLKWIIPLAIGAAVSGCTEVRTFFKKDACLDAGGMWDYQQHSCQTGALVTLYPVTYQPDGKPWPAMQDAVTRKKVLTHIDQLQPGDSSAVVVGKLGVAPLFYYDAESKNLHPVPTHYVMNYYFFRDENPTSATKSQFLTLLFDKQERLEKVWYNQMPELADRQLQVPLENMQDNPL